MWGKKKKLNIKELAQTAFARENLSPEEYQALMGRRKLSSTMFDTLVTKLDKLNCYILLNKILKKNSSLAKSISVEIRDNLENNKKKIGNDYFV